MGGFMPQSYIYVHAGVLVCGVWAIAASESTDAVLMVSAGPLVSNGGLDLPRSGS